MNDTVSAIAEFLADQKGEHILTLPVAHLTSMTEHMIICTGNSARHVQAMAKKLVTDMKEQQGLRPNHLEGEAHGEWVLVDYGDIVVHLMQAKTRAFYDLESLWQIEAAEQ